MKAPIARDRRSCAPLPRRDPASSTAGDAILAIQNGLVALRSDVRWRITLLEQATNRYTFGEPATIVADLGEWPAHDSIADPDWATVWDRLNLAGWDLGDDVTHRDELVPGGLWLRAHYRAPERVQDFRLMWPVGEFMEDEV
jgi:hypothetical protein